MNDNKKKKEDQNENEKFILRNVCNSVKRLQRKAAYYGLLPTPLSKNIFYCKHQSIE